MFELQPDPTFEAHVKGFVPGKPLKGCFVTFRYKDVDEYVAWREAWGERTVADVLMDIVVGWREAPLDFSRDALEQIAKKYPAFCTAILNTYRAQLFEARSGN